MTMRSSVLCVVCLLALAAFGQAQANGGGAVQGGAATGTQTTGGTSASNCPATGISLDAQPELPEITRGQTVTVKGCNFPDGVVTVRLNAGRPKADDIPLPATRANANTITFQVPADKVQTDRYLVWLEIAGQKLQVPGDLRVVADTSAPVHLDSAYPVTAYPTEKPGFDFEISGQNLAAQPDDNILIVTGRGPVSKCGPATAQQKNTCLDHLEVPDGLATRKLKIVGFRRGDYDGPVSIQVQVGKNVSNPVSLTFSRFAEGAVRWGSFLIFLAIMFAVFFIVWKGVGSTTIQTKRYNPFQSFFLDKATNSYSLSKFQMVLWTAVFVFGYVYLFLCRMLIQWKFELPPVPDGLPAMLAISAGTVIAAAGATEARGSKGAGDVHPSMADFISTGGLVVGERFQFFVWTLVATAGFVALLVMRDPATLMELPPIPQNFLYLMGISSVGYLAGKVVRKPGPVIKKLLVDALTPRTSGTAATMTIKLEGENLAEGGIIRVDDKELLKDVGYTFTEKTAQAQAPDPTFCTQLTVLLKSADDYIAGEHKITLINGDAQAASATFPVNALKLTSATTDGKTVTLIGENFGDGMTARYKKKDKSEQTVAVTKVSETEATFPAPTDNDITSVVLISGIKLESDPLAVTPKAKP
jgi:hypothetical protein